MGGLFFGENKMTKLVETSGFLKNIKTGVVFRRSVILASKSHMIPCDAHGNVEGQHEADIARAKNLMGRVKTRFLGNINNGALENWSDILAERDDMMSMNTFEEWERYKADRKKGAEAPVALDEPVAAPVLTRKKAEAEVATTPAPVIEPAPVETFANKLPNVEGLGSREAKTILSAWSETHYDHKIDRRPGLDQVISECEQLIADAESQSVAG